MMKMGYSVRPSPAIIFVVECNFQHFSIHLFIMSCGWDSLVDEFRNIIYPFLISHFHICSSCSICLHLPGIEWKENGKLYNVHWIKRSSVCTLYTLNDISCCVERALNGTVIFTIPTKLIDFTEVSSTWIEKHRKKKWNWQNNTISHNPKHKCKHKLILSWFLSKAINISRLWKTINYQSTAMVVNESW